MVGKTRCRYAVSIRSQPEGREIQVTAEAMNALQEVSIRSQPEGREIRHQAARHPTQIFVSIRSQPEGREIRNKFCVSEARHKLFQSAPNPKVGRYVH